MATEIEKLNNLKKYVKEEKSNIENNWEEYSSYGLEEQEGIKKRESIKSKIQKIKQEIKSQLNDLNESDTKLNKDNHLKSKLEIIKFYDSLETIEYRNEDIQNEEFLTYIFKTPHKFVDEDAKSKNKEKNYFKVRVKEKRGINRGKEDSKKLSATKLNNLLKSIKKVEDIKVCVDDVEYIYNFIIDAFLSYQKRGIDEKTLINTISSVIKGSMEKTKTTNEKTCGLFNMTTLTKNKEKGLLVLSTLIHKEKGEKLKMSEVSMENLSTINEFFNTLIYLEEDVFNNTTDQIEDLSNNLLDELSKGSENIGYSLARNIVDSNFEKINLKEILEGKLEYSTIVDRLTTELNGKYQDNKIAEIITLYVNFFENDFDTYKNEILTYKNGEYDIDFDKVHHYVTNNSFTYCKMYQLKNGIIQKERPVGKEREDYTTIRDFFPLLKYENQRLTEYGKPTGGSVDSVYYSRTKQRMIGTSTTVDTTGHVEGDQFLRHTYKTKRIDDYIKPIKDNINDYSFDSTQKNITEIIKNISKQGTEKENKKKEKEYKELLTTQYNNVENTFKEIIEHYSPSNQPYDPETNNKITIEMVDKIFEEIEYNFDMYGDIITKEAVGLHKFMEVVTFLEEQKAEDNKTFYDGKTLDYIYKKMNKRVKNYAVFQDLTNTETDKYEIFTEKLRELSIFLMDNLIDFSENNPGFDFSNTDLKKVFNNEETSRRLTEVKDFYVEFIQNIPKEDLKEAMLKLAEEDIILRDIMTFYRDTLNTIGEKHTRTKNFMHRNIVKFKYKETTIEKNFLFNSLTKMIDCKKINFTEIQSLLITAIIGEDRAIEKLEKKEKEVEEKNKEVEEKNKEVEEKNKEVEEKNKISEMKELIKNNKIQEEKWLRIKKITKEDLKKYRILAEEKIFIDLLIDTNEEVGIELYEMKESDNSLKISNWVIETYFDNGKGEEKIRKQIEGMKNKNLSNLAEETEIELEKTIQEILKEENIDISKEETKGVINKFGK